MVVLSIHPCVATGVCASLWAGAAMCCLVSSVFSVASWCMTVFVGVSEHRCVLCVVVAVGVGVST